MDLMRVKMLGFACASLIVLFLSASAQTPSNGPVSYTYDEQGRLIAVIDAAGNAAVYNYDPVGNILSIQRYISSQVSVISFTPERGLDGSSVTITGTGFSTTPSQNTVSFNGITALVTSSTSTQITTAVPTGATTGPITVTTPAGTATSTKNFTIVAQSSAPTISGFSPQIGAAGAAVTITGTNFDSSPGNDRVRFNNIADGSLSAATSTSVSTLVPAGTGSGHIRIATPNGTAVSADDFFVPLPGFTAASVGETGRIVIGAAQSVTLGAGQTGIFVFDANRGQRVAVQASNSTIASGSLYLIGANGTTLATAGLTTSGGSLNPSASLSVTGTYAIGVNAGSGGGSVSFQLNDASDVVGAISIDGPPVTVTTTIPGQDAWLKFNATAGQQVVLQATNVSNPSATVKVIGSTGEPVPNASISIGNSPAGHLFFLDQQFLPATGSYAIQVTHSGSNIGSETLQLSSAQDFIASVTPGGPPVRVPALGDTRIGQNGRVEFTATAGQKVSANIFNSTYPSSPGCNAAFTDASGAFLNGGWTCSTGAPVFIDTVTAPTAGTYHFFVNPSAMATGNITVQLNDASDVTRTISIDGPAVTETTMVEGQDARLSFNAIAGQRVVLQVSSVTNPSGTVYLLKPDGTTQTSFTIGNSPAGQLFFLDTQTLAISGTYTVWVRHSGTNVGSATFQLNSVPQDYSGSLALGTPAQVPPGGSLSIGQNATLTFAGTAGFDANIQFTGNTLSSANVTVLNPDGSTLTKLTGASGANFSVPLALLPTTGVYTIVIDPVGTATGSFSVVVTLLGGSTPPPVRSGNSAVNPGNPLSQNLVGLFLMNEGTGTMDANVVDGQTAAFAGTTLPVWNTTDPSVVLNGTTASQSSFLNAGTDLNFDQLTPNKMTVVAKVFLNTVQHGGIAEKNDNNSSSGFVFGLDSAGALVTEIVRSGTDTRVATGAGTVASGQWMQVAFTWDGTVGTAAAAHIYVNGVEQTKVSSVDGTGTIGYAGATNQPFRIGNATFDTIAGSLKGKIAYLAVYKYRVLTPTELNQLDAQLPITTDVVGSTTENGAPTTVTTAMAGQNAHVSFQGWANQQVAVQLSNNTMGQVTVNLVAPDGTTVTTMTSSATSFSLPVVTLPLNGTYDVFVQPSVQTTGSITISVAALNGIRPTSSAVNPGNPLSQNLVGLFLMNEGTGTMDANVVDGQTAAFAGTTLPVWNTTDPSVVLNGTTASQSSFLNAGTDLNFDQLTPNKMTVVAKVFLNTVQHGGIAEKNDNNSTSGFLFGLDGTGALVTEIVRTSTDTRVATGAGTVTSGQWMQVAFTWDGTVGTAAAAHIYVNGVEQTKVSSVDGTGTIGYAGATNQPFRIGNASFDTIAGSLNGRIAYLAVYKYRVLTPAELNQLDAQLPITTDVVRSTTENGAATTVTTATAGQNAHVSFQGWANQQVTVQLSNNTMGQVTVNLVAPDGSTVASTISSATSFTLPMTTLPALTGMYDVFVQGPTAGSITIGVITTSGGRPSGSVTDPNNPLSTDLVGLFLMNEATGTTDANVVDGQTAAFAGTTLPVWNTTDPSVVLKGTTASQSSFLNAGTDLNFDQLTPNKMTIVAKVFLNTVQQGGIAEKNDNNSTSGFLFGLDSTGALVTEIVRSSTDTRVATGAGTVASGQWMQVAFTWDGTVGTAAAVHIYVNGVEQTKVSSVDGAGTIGYAGATNQPFRIGNASFDTIAGSLNGKIAYLAVYRGRILSNVELNQLDTQLPIQ